MKNKIQKERDKIEQEKNMLKLTLDMLINENNSLKNTLNETETNVKANKDQLKDKFSPPDRPSRRGKYPALPGRYVRCARQ